MHQKLDLDGVAALLKSDAESVRELFEMGRLHGVCKDGRWTTTFELLESDLELFTEAARGCARQRVAISSAKVSTRLM